MRFLTSLAVEGGVAASTQNQALSALLFLYRDVLVVDLPWLDGVVRAKRPQRLPVVLTRQEVRALVQRLTGVPHLMACLTGHLAAVRAQHQDDLARGAGWVELPTALPLVTQRAVSWSLSTLTSPLSFPGLAKQMMPSGRSQGLFELMADGDHHDEAHNFAVERTGFARRSPRR